MTNYLDTMKLASDMGVGVVAHRVTKNPIAKNGSNAIFTVNMDGITLSRSGSGEKEVIDKLSAEGVKVLFERS